MLPPTRETLQLVLDHGAKRRGGRFRPELVLARVDVRNVKELHKGKSAAPQKGGREYGVHSCHAWPASHNIDPCIPTMPGRSTSGLSCWGCCNANEGGKRRGGRGVGKRSSWLVAFSRPSPKKCLKPWCFLMLFLTSWNHMDLRELSLRLFLFSPRGVGKDCSPQCTELWCYSFSCRRGPMCGELAQAHGDDHGQV